MRLRQRGVHAGKARVLRLMGVHGLLASRGRGTSTAIPPTPVASRPSGPTSSGTDATCFWSERDGWCWFFGAIDHATDELVGWKATKRGDRWAALEPLYPGVRYAFGWLGKDVARGLTVRTDWGPQYTAHAFGAELRWLGIQQLAIVRRRAAVQRGDRAFHADAEGAVPVAAPLQRSRPGRARARGL